MSGGSAARGLASICLISSGINRLQVPLQPWRYLYEVARQLANQGHKVTILTDRNAAGNPVEVTGELRVRQLNSIKQLRWWRNRPLNQVIASLQPDVLLWHIGITSFLYQRFSVPTTVPVLGVFTSPLYTASELATIGWCRLLRSYRLSGMHLMSTFAPRPFLRRMARCQPQLSELVVQTERTRRRLLHSGIWTRPVQVIPPGVDSIWRSTSAEGKPAATRKRLGMAPSDQIIVYFGPPSPLRGVHTLIAAFALLRGQHPDARLLILSRSQNGETGRQERRLLSQCVELGIQPYVRLVHGFLVQETLVDYVRASDVVALPFELVSSDAPLSLLEACAMGKRIVTTPVSGLPDAALTASKFVSEPGNIVSLAQALHHALLDLPCWPWRPAQGSSLLQEGPLISSWQQVGARWSQLIQDL